MDGLAGWLDLPQLLTSLALALMAFLLGGVLGWERHAADRPAGLRTFPIVAVASCAYVLLAQSLFGDDAGAQARVIQGLLTGIGFIGGGAILKDSDKGGVFGLATAASIWNTGAIGAAVGYQRFEIALVLTALNFVILRLLPPAGPDIADS